LYFRGEENFSRSNDTIIGYYHILAEGLEDAVATARQNPEFEFSSGASVEVRPIKTREERTVYKYPKKENRQQK